jgi:hypothetical protein
MTLKEMLARLLRKPTQSVPDTGKMLAGLSKNSSYDAAVAGTLGVDVFEVGGLKRCTSLSILRKLDYSDELIALLLERGVIEQEVENFSASNEALPERHHQSASNETLPEKKLRRRPSMGAFSRSASSLRSPDGS